MRSDDLRETEMLIGVDVGGTFIKVGVVTQNGKIIDKKKVPTPKYAGYKTIISVIKDYLKQYKISGIGIGVPGFVNTEKGIVHKLVNIKGWDKVPLRKIIEKATKVPVSIDNDVNCMAIGEVKFGMAKNKKNVFCMTLGTGVGGGLIINGKIYRGSSFTAGEVGHITLDKNGPRCNCGNNGCLEAFVGNKRIIVKAKRIGIDTPEELTMSAKKGDKKALQIWKEIGEDIGTVLAGIVNLVNPELIVIGGGVANAGDVLMKYIKKTVKERSIFIAGNSVKIVFSRLGNDAGVLGAAALALAASFKEA